MKQNNRQTSLNARSTKAEYAGLSLLTPIISNYEISLTVEQKKQFDCYCKRSCISPSHLVSFIVCGYIDEILMPKDLIEC